MQPYVGQDIGGFGRLLDAKFKDRELRAREEANALDMAYKRQQMEALQRKQWEQQQAMEQDRQKRIAFANGLKKAGYNQSVVNVGAVDPKLGSELVKIYDSKDEKLIEKTNRDMDRLTDVSNFTKNFHQQVLGGKPIDQLTPQDVQTYEDGLRATGFNEEADVLDNLDPRQKPFFIRDKVNAGLAWGAGQKKGPLVQNIVGDQTPPGIKKLSEIQAETFNKSYVEASKTASSLAALEDAQKLFDAGINSGFGAEWLTLGQKILKKLRIPVPDEVIANTETFKAFMGKQVAQIIKEFGSGTGLSDADREYAEKIVGGKITLDDGALRNLLALGLKHARMGIEKHNKLAKQVMSKPGFKESMLFSPIISIPTGKPKNTDIEKEIEKFGDNLKEQGWDDKKIIKEIQKKYSEYL